MEKTITHLVTQIEVLYTYTNEQVKKRSIVFVRDKAGVDTLTFILLLIT